MFKIIKKADIVLIILLLIAGLASSFFLATGSARGTKAVVTVDGKVYATQIGRASCRERV